MFKKFTVDDNVSGQSQMKTSAVRKVKAAIVESYPTLAADLDIIFPKNAPIMASKGEHRTEFIAAAGRAWFFQLDGGQWLPTLHTLHRWPDLLPHMRVDKGAIRFVMKGSHIMAPGFTSAGGDVDCGRDEPLPVGAFVAVHAEGMTHAVAIGELKMTTAEITELGKGVGVDNVHFLGDGLWDQDSKFADKK
jgi:PUA domain protein